MMPTIVRELTDRRDAVTKHHLQDDGSILATISGAPVHYQDIQGNWQDIDIGWDDAGAFYVSRANAFGVRVYKALTSSGVVFSRGAGSLTMVPTRAVLLNAATKATQQLALPDTTVIPTLSADATELTYANLYPGVDLVFVHDALGVRERIVLPTRPTLPDPTTLGWAPDDTWLCWTARLAWAGWTPQGVVHGTEQTDAVGLADGTGTVQALLPRMWARTATGGRGRVFRRFVQVAGNWFVLYGIPYRAVRNANYPVVIDPSTTLNSDTGDGFLWYLNGAYSGVSTGSTTLDVASFLDGKVGYYWYRAFAKFTLSGWSTRTIGSASIAFYGNSVVGVPIPILERINDFGTLESSDWAAAAQETLSSSLGIAVGAYNSQSILNSFITQKTTAWYAVRLRNTTELTVGADTAKYNSTDFGSNKPKIDITYYEAHTQNTPTAGVGQVDLSWVLSGGLVSGDHQAIYYQANASASEPAFPDDRTGWTLFGSTAAYNATSITVTGLTGGTQYWFKVVDVQVVSAVNYEGSVSTGQKATPTGGGAAPAIPRGTTGWRRRPGV